MGSLMKRGNYVSYDFKLKEGKISELSDVTVSIYKGDEKLQPIRL